MGKDVPPQNQIRRTPIRSYCFGIGSVEKLTSSRNPGLDRNFADIFRRFHAQNITTALLEFFQEYARIAGDFQDLWACAKLTDRQEMCRLIVQVRIHGARS